MKRNGYFTFQTIFNIYYYCFYCAEITIDYNPHIYNYLRKLLQNLSRDGELTMRVPKFNHKGGKGKLI